MLKPSNSKMKTAIFIIFFLFIAINIVALTIVNWGGKERRLGLKTLHKSTMKKVSSQLNSNFAIFNNSKSVVIVQDAFKNDSVFFVDLINHTTKKLDLNQDKKLNISELIPLDDKVIAIYREGLEKNYAYIVDKSGNIKELSYIEEPLRNDPGKDKEIKDYLEKNFDVKFTRIKLDSSNSKSEVRGFYNDDIFISCYNPQTCISFSSLEKRSSRSEEMYKFGVNRSFSYDGYKVEIERNSEDKKNDEIDSSYFNWIKKVTISKDGKKIKEYPVTGLFYAAVIPVGDKLYFVGKSVTYVELGDLE